MDKPSEDLLSLLPPIRRARGWRLYAEDGRRFLDLWQDDGRSILGAKGTGIGTVAKAGVDRGLSSPLPSLWAGRLERDLLRLHPEWQATRFFPDEGGARGWLESLDLEILVLRPFMEFLSPLEGRPEAAILRLPCPRALSPAVVLLRGETATVTPAGPQVPPLLLQAACKALAEFRGYTATFNESHWRKADRRLGAVFARQGPWLFPRCAAPDYPGLFRKALDKGILLSPCHALPSLVPGEFDDGEMAPLASLA